MKRQSKYVIASGRTVAEFQYSLSEVANQLDTLANDTATNNESHSLNIQDLSERSKANFHTDLVIKSGEPILLNGEVMLIYGVYTSVYSYDEWLKINTVQPFPLNADTELEQ